MSSLQEELSSYLALRRALGSELRGPDGRLRRFVEFLDREDATVITTELALRWATAPADIAPSTWAVRLGEVRRFARWLSASEPRTQVPPYGLLPFPCRRRTPYLYRDEDVARIVGEALRLPSPTGLRAWTFATLFGLLAATGLRLGEALALDRDDVDLRAGVIAVQRGKFGKSRFVPIHDSTCAALRRYARRRDRCVPHPSSGAFLLSERGHRPTPRSAQHNFALVTCALGLRPPAPAQGDGRGPRLHDLRHRLATATLVRWYREGRDVGRELPKLSTYLGHVQVTGTYWYIEAIPELLRLATERAMTPREYAP
ncbi:MAG: tyrosine-type recombinase/integrase [Deltaproteobacteria bacterium]|nr:tyrosine-type recombinase/integrase [Deltaproteobacteria bacterium]